MAANDRQVGGEHYLNMGAVQHWDLSALYQWDPMQYQIIKYTMRWRDKNGLLDLEKVVHFAEKYIEDVKAGRMPGPGQYPLKPLDRECWLDLLGAVDARQYERLIAEYTACKDALYARAAKAESPVDEPEEVFGWLEKYNVRRGFSRDGTQRLLDEYMIIPKDSVKPTAWKGFTFEGTKDGHDWYRCVQCREHFEVPMSDPPLSHRCAQVSA